MFTSDPYGCASGYQHARQSGIAVAAVSRCNVPAHVTVAPENFPRINTTGHGFSHNTGRRASCARCAKSRPNPPRLWLPLEAMRNHVCWMCKGNTSHQIVADPKRVNTIEAKVFSDDPNHYVVAAIYQCMVCSGISVGIANVPQNVVTGPSPMFRGWVDSVSNLLDGDFTWRPSATDSQDYPDVPTPIANAATEAFECHSSGHYRAAILLSRSVIEATAKQKGITTGNLKNKIEEMANQHLIRPHIKAVADGIRDYGNDMAHGDFVAPVSAEESALVIQLMGEILDEVYQSPARLAAVQQAFANRQQGGGQQ
jgi:hypothetical protein